MEKVHHIILVCGWWSSIIFVFKLWAKRLLKNFLKPMFGNRLGQDVIVWIVSSDFMGEKKAFDAVLKDHKAGRLGVVVIVGHSNGGRDGPARGSRKLAEHGVQIPYAAVIDMTLAEFGAKVHGNVWELDDFHARLERADLDESFIQMGRTYNLFELDEIEGHLVGHTQAASLPFVQKRIAKKIKAVIPQPGAKSVIELWNENHHGT